MEKINEEKLKDVTGGVIIVVNNSSNNSEVIPADGQCPEGYVLNNGECVQDTNPLYDENGMRNLGAVSKL